jgi:hypothetical protein
LTPGGTFNANLCLDEDNSVSVAIIINVLQLFKNFLALITPICFVWNKTQEEQFHSLLSYDLQMIKPLKMSFYNGTKQKTTSVLKIEILSGVANFYPVFTQLFLKLTHS